MLRRCRFLTLLCLTLLLAACRDREVTAYRIPKEKENPRSLPLPATGAELASTNARPAMDGGMAATPVATASGAGLIWTAPAHWKTKPASAMRKGSYAVPGADGTEADLSITAFPGDVGGELANLNRWRGQIQLPPFAESDLAGAVTRFEQAGLKFAVVDFASAAGAPPQRVLGAIVPAGGATWFFKLSGPDAVVAKEKPAFLEFLKTVKASAPVAP